MTVTDATRQGEVSRGMALASSRPCQQDGAPLHRSANHTRDREPAFRSIPPEPGSAGRETGAPRGPGGDRSSESARWRRLASSQAHDRVVFDDAAGFDHAEVHAGRGGPAVLVGAVPLELMAACWP